MNRRLITLMLIVLCYTFVWGETTFKVTTQEGVEMTFEVISEDEKTCKLSQNCIASSTEGAITIPDVANDYTVIEVGFQAFSGCSDLTSVSISNRVITIDQYAFIGCSSLTNVVIPNSVTTISYMAFGNCTGLTSVTIGSSVTTLDSSAFSGCNSLSTVVFNCPEVGRWFNDNTTLETVVLGNNVTTIDEYAFSCCSNLKSINLTENLSSIGNGAFYACVGIENIIIPNSLTTIGYRTFYGCSGLTTINIGTGVTTIGDYAFEDCVSLDNIIIPDNVKTIGAYAFEDCTGLASVTIGKGVQEIGSGAFNGCSNLTSATLNCPEIKSRDWFWAIDIKTLVLGDNVTSIADEAFEYNRELETVVIGNGIKDIGKETFYNCTKLKNITLSENLQTIGESAFQNCSAIEEILLPNSLTSIGKDAFSSCSSLQSVDLPESLTKIGRDAFSGCTSLSEITIPKNVVMVGGGHGSFVDDFSGSPFRGCNLLTKVTVESQNLTGWFCDLSTIKDFIIGTNVTTISGDAFSGCTGIETIIVVADNTIYDSRENCNAIIETTTNKLLYGFGTTVIPETVTAIATYAFMDCTTLTEITIPAGVTEIGSSAFSGCTGLQTVTSYMDTPIGNPDFNSDVKSSATLRVPYLKSNVYRNNYYWNFTNIVEMDGSPEEMAVINFADPVAKSICVNNWDINGDGEISMGEAKLVTSISGFSGNTELVSFDELQYFTNVTSIDNSAFSGCSGLTSLTIPSNVTSIGYSAFSGCNSLASVLLPNGLTTIESGTFSGCSGLTSVIIPNSVTSIGDYAFSGCSKLTSITLPEGVTTIGQYAFNGSGLLSINIPSTVTSIGNYALAGDVIYCDLTTPIAIGYIISQPSEVILYVPKGCEEAFRNADYWKDFIIANVGGQNTDWSEGEIVVDVEDAGELRLAIIERDEESISRLKIRGSLNSTDIQYLIEGTGKLADLESLDLSDVTLEYDDECYLTIIKEDGVYGLGGRRFKYYYYLSENENKIVSSDSWGTDFATRYYSPYLAGVFQNKTYKHVVLPKSVKKAAESIFSGCEYLESVKYPGSISRVGEFAFENCRLLDAITLSHADSIGENAFIGCKLLQNVEGMNEVKYIGANAFSGCTSLTNVSLLNVDSIPSKAFYGCVMLDNLTLSDNLYFIGENAFAGCKRVASVALPESLATLSPYAFTDCSSLSEVTYSAKLMKLDYTCFQNTPFMEALPVEGGIKYMGHIALVYDTDSGVADASPAALAFREGTTYIADNFMASMYVDYNHSYSGNVTTISFPSTLRKVGDKAFCSSNITTFNVASLTLPESLEEIGSQAFYDAQQLTKVTIPEGLKKVGDEAFAYCSKLNIVNYNAVELVGKGLFSNCTNIEKVTIGVKVELLPESIFSGCSALTIVKSTARSEVTPFEIGSSAFNGCSVLSKLELPEDVIAIGEEAFSGCSVLKSFVCSESLETIGGSAFSGCSGLTDVQLNEGLKTIGEYAFGGCNNITAFQLPESLDSLGAYAFSDCYALTEITIPASVTRLGSQFLYDCYNLTTLTSLIKEPMNLDGIISMSNQIIKDVYGYAYNWSQYSNIHYDEVTLYVPDGTKTLYRNAEGWNRFENIEELSGNDVTAHNKLSVEDANIVRGMKTSIPVNLMNDVLDFQAYQFDLIVPRGISIAEKAGGGMDVTIGSRYSVAGQSVSVKKLAVNQYSKVDKYRFVFFSPTGTITGTDGTLLTVTLKASNTIKAGNYQPTLENIIFTQSNGTESVLDKVHFALSVNNPTGGLLGDASDDGRVTVTDAVCILNYILGKPLAGFNADAADVDGDGEITIADAVGVMSIIMNSGASAPKMDMKELE